MSKKIQRKNLSSRKRSQNSRSRVDKTTRDAGITEHEDRGGARDNDVEWYAGDEYLLADSARLPFSNPAGFATTIPSANAWTQEGPVSKPAHLSIPAIAAIHLAPTLGADTGNTSPINVQARRVFGFIRANQTVNAVYNQVTLMMYLVAMTSLYSFYAFCARLYGLLGTYQHRNRALPIALFKAMGIDFADFDKNKANFRYWLNDFANSVGALALPAEMSYTKRQMWLYQNVFKDGLNEKAQLYIYVPEYFMLYNPIGHTVGAMQTPSLEYYNFGPLTGLKFDKIREIGETMLSRVFNNNVINTISGDIIKAYGYDRIWQLVPIGEEYMVEPVLELNVLDQIHNLFIPKAGYTFGAGTAVSNIIADVAYEEIDEANSSSYLKPNYHVNKLSVGTEAIPPRDVAAHTLGMNGVIIDFDRQDVTPADVMVATRLTAVPYGYPNTGSASQIPASNTILCGSEVVTRVVVFYALKGNTDFVNAQVSLISAGGESALYLRPFYKHPIAYSINAASATADINLSLSSDIENWTFLDASDLFKLHETALKSEFKVPLVGRLIK